MPARPDVEPRLAAPLFGAAVALVAFLSHARALGHGFVWDDLANIVQNPWLRDASGIADAFTRQVAGFDPGFTTSYFRPVMHLAYRSTYALAGLDPRAFHGVNLVLHTLASVLVFLTCRAVLARLGERGQRVPALVAGLVFAVHPVHVESVSWIAGITDLSFTVFGLACLLTYLTSRSPVGFAISGVWLLLALLSKETAAVIPAIVLSIELLGPRLEGLLSRTTPIVLALIVYAALRWSALGGFAPHDNRIGVGVGTGVLAGFVLFATYLRYLLFPVPLTALHPFSPPASPLDPRTLASFLVVAAFVTAFAGARRWPAGRIALAWIALPLLPVLWIPALGEGVFAERYLYFPSAGFALLVGAVAARLVADGPQRLLRPLAAILAFALTVAGVASWHRAGVWRDSLSLWSDAVSKAPASAAAREYLCFALYEARRFDEAAAECRESLRLDSTRVDARINLGNALAMKGDLDGALAALDEALRRRPTSVEAWTTRGLVRMAQGAIEDALASYRRALEIHPGNAEAHNVLGVAYARLGRLEEARVEILEAVRLAPEHEEYRRNLESLGGPP